jgi:hypothetical protein
VFDKNELEHIEAFKNGNRFETNMGHKDCLRCDVVSGKYGSNREHEFLEFDHKEGKNIPRNLGHSDCKNCMAGDDYLDLHALKNAEISVDEKGSIRATYKR